MAEPVAAIDNEKLEELQNKIEKLEFDTKKMPDFEKIQK